MKTFLKVAGVVVAAALVVLGGGVLLAQNGVDNPVSDAAGQAANNAANAALDASGVKGRIDSALRDNAGAIAEKAGLPVSAVNGMIDGIDIESWQVTSLPSGVVETGSSSIDYGGASATITTYDDPSVVTVQTDAGAVTMEVPESAQGYLQYLEHL